jgi:hypothetical protein
LRREEVKISGPLHAFEALHGKHGGLVRSVTQQKDRLTELARLAHAPGFALTHESELVMLAHEAWQLSFQNLLQVAARIKGVGIDGQERMEWAMYDRLLNGPQREKVGYWQQMIDVGVDYANRRRLILMNSSNRVRSEITKTQKQLGRFCEEHGIDR